MRTRVVIECSVMLLAIAACMMNTEVFADHSKVNVDVTEGSSVPGCEENNECYTPYNVSVDIGGEVTWANNDTAAHTVTSGTPNDGPDGLFDSSLFTSGTTFSVKFTDDKFGDGDYHYFCMVHPWMEGIITVEATTSDDDYEDTVTSVDSDDDEEITTIQNISADGSIRIDIETSKPVSNEMMSIDVKFYDHQSGELQEHMNYDMTVTQADEVVLSAIGAHAHDGIANHTTTELSSDEQVDIDITLQGIGIDDITGPRGETIEFTVVPEFGVIAIAVLTVAIISTTILTTKYRITKF